MALGDGIAPVVFPGYELDLTITLGPSFTHPLQVGLSPVDSSLNTTGGNRPNSGQIYPRGAK